MREEVVQWAWNKGLIKGREVYSQDEIIVHQVGKWNKNEPGPDFKSASLSIGKIRWYGDVEIHIKSSDWNRHNHSRDTAYQNVILHVVVENDVSILTHEKAIPTLIISCELYKWLKKIKPPNSPWLACQAFDFPFSSTFIKSQWEKRMLRKLKEDTNEIQIAKYLVQKSKQIIHYRRSGRLRTSKQYLVSCETARETLKCFPYQMEVLNKTLMSCGFTSFESFGLIINGFVPLHWAESKEDNMVSFCKRLKPEKNKIISKFHAAGIIANNAFESQALLEIYRELCSNQDCLNCERGIKILKS